MRPLGRIVGLTLKKKKEDPKREAPKEAADENMFHQMVNFKPKEEEEQEEEMLPLYEPPAPFMRSLVHIGTMKRIR